MPPPSLPPRTTLTNLAVGFVVLTAQLPLLLLLLPGPLAPILYALVLTPPILGLLILVLYIARGWQLLAVLGAIWWSFAAILGLFLPFALSVPLADRLFADSRVVFQFTPVSAVLGVAMVLFLVCGLHVASGIRVYSWSVAHADSRPRHLCRDCSYDLRATPNLTGPLFDRCPECGRLRTAR